MLSTDYAQLALLISAIIAVLAAILAWIAATGQRESVAAWVSDINNWCSSVELGHQEVIKALKKCQESVADVPDAAWRSQIDADIADLRDAVATQGGTLRRLQARKAARTRHEPKPEPESTDPKEALRQLARDKGML